MGVGSEEHQNSTFDRLVQTEDKFAKVFVALVKVLVVEIKLKLVTLIVAADNRRKYLAFSNEVFTDQLHLKIWVKVVLEYFHRGKSTTCQNNGTRFLVDQ